MASPRLRNYLRMYRRKSGLTQKELAFLLGGKHLAKISLYERFIRMPHLPTVIAYEVLFQTVSNHLFGGLRQEIENEILKRAHQLLEQKTAHPKGKRDQSKIRFLQKLVKTMSKVEK